MSGRTDAVETETLFSSEWLVLYITCLRASIKDVVLYITVSSCISIKDGATMVRTQAHGRLHRMLHKKKKIGADRHATMHVFAWCVSTGCSPAMPSGEGFSTVR
jgi:hypothetical protein